MIGCGEVAEVKSGPALQKAEGSALMAVMRRDRAKAEDFARRHGVQRAYTEADTLINDPEVDAVYIATPPSSHCELALKVAAAGKPCLVEKPMATSHAECLRMVDAFRAAQRPLWVAYYRRALPRFLKVRELLRDGAIGRVTSVHMSCERPARDRGKCQGLAIQPRHFRRRIVSRSRLALLRHRRFPRRDGLPRRRDLPSTPANRTPRRTSRWRRFQIGDDLLGTGVWNFNASESVDSITFTGSKGQLTTAVRADADVSVTRDGQQNTYRFRNPAHVHQPLIQTIVDELRGRGRCESTGETGARASWVMERCLESYYK